MAGRKPDLRVVSTGLGFECGALTLAVAALAKTPVENDGSITPGHDGSITPGLPDMLPDLSAPRFVRPLGPSLDQATTTNSNSRAALTAGKREAHEPGAANSTLDTEQPAPPGQQYKALKQEDLTQHDKDTHTDQEQEEPSSQPPSKRPRILDAAAQAAMQAEEQALEAHNRLLEQHLMAAIKEISAINRQNICMCRVLSLAGSAAAAVPGVQPCGTADHGFPHAAAAAQGSSGGGRGGSCGGSLPEAAAAVTGGAAAAAMQEQAAAAAAVSQGTACTVSNTVSNVQQQGGAVAARQLMAGPGWGCGGDSTPVLQQLQGGIADQHSVVQPPKQFAQRRLPGGQQQRPKGVSLLVVAAQQQRPDDEQPKQQDAATDALAVSSGAAAASDGAA